MNIDFIKGFGLAFAVLWSVAVNSQELIIYVVPSPGEINWKSPSSLMLSTFSNTLKTKLSKAEYPIGHLYIGLRHNERQEEYWSGTTRAPKNSTNRKVLREGYGMGILFADIEGRLQQTHEVKSSIAAIENNQSSSYLRIALSEENYDRLRDYLIEYDIRSYWEIYNGLNMPRKGLGAGCAEFGMSFFEVAGIDISEWKEDWSVEVAVPDRLIGGLGLNKHISVLKLFLSRKWAKEDEPHFIFSVFEPNQMHQWIKDKWTNSKEESNSQWMAEKNSTVKGLFLDQSDVPPPEDPLFFIVHEREE